MCMHIQNCCPGSKQKYEMGLLWCETNVENNRASPKEDSKKKNLLPKVISVNTICFSVNMHKILLKKKRKKIQF